HYATPSTFHPIEPNKTLAFVIHGYTDDYRKPALMGIKNALLKYTKGEVGCVVMVDWSHGSDHNVKIVNPRQSYIQSVANIQLVGRQVVQLVDAIIGKRHIEPSKVYLVGHSLGAQAASFAGKYAKKVKNWTFGRITGLEPAAPLF